MENLPISITDIAVGVILLLSGLLALTRGFVHETLSIGSWLGAAFAGLYGFPYVRPYMRELIETEIIADVVAGAGTFIVALIVLTIVTKLVAEQVQGSALNPLDRSLGFVFGLLRGVVIVCLLYTAVEWMIPPAKQPVWLRDAKSMPLIEQGSAFLKGLIPSDAGERIANEAEDIRDQSNNALQLKKTFDKMLTPEAKSDTSTANDPQGYDQQERKDLDRLIRNAQ
ncbi:CvpA family protein [Terasakiella sp. A23]|uniref:CvpA family protein n=1 Tax=Terasakiella sp. FCG-A23 TaxID=3080561 RepID=UPI002954DCEF|nr:CvpA family protein [Terasakiella sp. A23]MDV7340646.1 CvpA family protein [Terasakiella sp. A23]